MIAILRTLSFAALAAALTWWFLVRAPGEAAGPRPLRVAVDVREPVPTPESSEALVSPPAAPTREVKESELAPPAPELGAPDSEGELAATSDEGPEIESQEPSLEEAVADQEPSSAMASESTGELGGRPVDELRADAELVERARAELSGEARQGFATTLLAAPEDQLAIARAFGEELVLVPKAALGEGESSYFRLDLSGSPRVEAVRGPFRAERFLFYRDLFAYDYSSLPAPVRKLRRQVVTRSDVHWFAALIPTSEFAVVVGRRDEALRALGIELEDVRRFVLRYHPTAEGGFDLRVEQVELADGRRERIVP